MIEIWKDVKGYEGLYRVSSLGRVKSLARAWVCGKGKGKLFQKDETILKQLNAARGYKKVTLCNGKTKKQKLVHQLVAISFINNPENKKEVNHKNGIKTDNSLENLEWCTRKENENHARQTGLKITPCGNESWKAKKVLDRKTGKIYGSVQEAANVFGINKFTLASRLNGNHHNHTTLTYL